MVKLSISIMQVKKQKKKTKMICCRLHARKNKHFFKINIDTSAFSINLPVYLNKIRLNFHRKVARSRYPNLYLIRKIREYKYK